ncbi:MAG: hypothetical protein AAGA66_06115 [Bacteroidota bacterium]
MLFKKKFLDLIEKGAVRIAFRRWTRASVTEHGTLLTPVGQLRITSLKLIDYADISDDEISQAGYKDRKELDKELAFKDVGDIYKIAFDLERADPRMELRT